MRAWLHLEHSHKVLGILVCYLKFNSDPIAGHVEPCGGLIGRCPDIRVHYVGRVYEVVDLISPVCLQQK